MRTVLLFSLMVVGVGFHAAHASLRSLTPQEHAATCYPSSPMLQSDLCWGKPYTGGFPGASTYRTQPGDPFSEIYALMYSLQGQSGMGSFDPMMGLNLTPSMLWQNSGAMGNSPLLNGAYPLVK